MRARALLNFVIFMVSAVGLVTSSITELTLLGRVIFDVTAAIEAFNCNFHGAIMVGTGLLSSRLIDSCLSISSWVGARSEAERDIMVKHDIE